MHSYSIQIRLKLQAYLVSFSYSSYLFLQKLDSSDLVGLLSHRKEDNGLMDLSRWNFTQVFVFMLYLPANRSTHRLVFIRWCIYHRSVFGGPYQKQTDIPTIAWFIVSRWRAVVCKSILEITLIWFWIGIWVW